jgi:hypothetical protein
MASLIADAILNSSDPAGNSWDLQNKPAGEFVNRLGSFCGTLVIATLLVICKKFRIICYDKLLLPFANHRNTARQLLYQEARDLRLNEGMPAM